MGERYYGERQYRVKVAAIAVERLVNVRPVRQLNVRWWWAVGVSVDTPQGAQSDVQGVTARRRSGH